VANSEYNWQANIQIVANRTFVQFAIIDDPLVHGPEQMTTYYVNGSSFKPDSEDYEVEQPYYVKINHDKAIEHGRNSYVKNELFYYLTNQNSPGEKMSYIIKQGQDEGAQHSCKSKKLGICVNNILSNHDVWCQTKKNFKVNTLIDIYQTVSVHRDQYALL